MDYLYQNQNQLRSEMAKCNMPRFFYRLLNKD